VSQVPVFISPRNRVAQLYPRALGSLYVVRNSYPQSGCQREITGKCAVKVVIKHAQTWNCDRSGGKK
jgi:hypothetical protein